MTVDGARVNRVVELVTTGFISKEIIASLYKIYTEQVQGVHKNYNKQYLAHATYMKNFHGAVLSRLGGTHGMVRIEAS